jgi:hypothetical protein
MRPPKVQNNFTRYARMEVNNATQYLIQGIKDLPEIDYGPLAFPYSALMMSKFCEREALWDRIIAIAKLIAILKYRLNSS